MKGYLVHQLFTLQQTQECHNLFNKLTWREQSTQTGELPKKLKNNLEPIVNDIYQNIVNTFFQVLDTSEEFFNFCNPLTTTKVVLSRTPEKGYFKAHHDHYSFGDYSTTLFLSPPDSYEGGELNLYIDNEVKKIKLNPGWAVSYPSGTPHEVVTVKKGVRDAIVFWTKSRIKDPFVRELYFDLNKVLHKLHHLQTVPQSLEEAVEDPFFLLMGVTQRVLAKYSE